MVPDLESEPEELQPAWADLEPPRFDLVRAGVRYTDVSCEPLLELLRGAEIRVVLAAMGPALFFGRSDGPFVPYDLELKDQNEDCRVLDRDFPWCWGDVLWIAATWEGMPTAVQLSKLDELGDLYCAVGTGRVSAAEMETAVVRRARGVAGAYFARVRPPLFRESLLFSRDGLQPPTGSRGREPGRFRSRSPR